MSMKCKKTKRKSVIFALFHLISFNFFASHLQVGKLQTDFFELGVALIEIEIIVLRLVCWTRTTIVGLIHLRRLVVVVLKRIIERIGINKFAPM